MTIKVLFTAGECLPFAKTGGLADVIGALPQAMAERDAEVRVAMPLYQSIKERFRAAMVKEMDIKLDFPKLKCIAGIFSLQQNDICYYFIDQPEYFNRPNLYAYPDDSVRFGVFQLAVLEMLKKLNWRCDIINTHDWHSGVIPWLAKTRHQESFANVKFVHTIHNLAYQGIFSVTEIPGALGISDQEALSFAKRNKFNYMKMAIEYSDKIVTVSPSYASEILTPEYGEKLQSDLLKRRNDLSGILNGIDYGLWNPQTDPDIAANFSEQGFAEGKRLNKLALQQALGLTMDDSVFLAGMVSRLTWQKGIHLLIEKMAELLAKKVQLVVLGSGEKKAERQLKQLAKQYQGRLAYFQGYNEELAHQIYAASDLFLMPSLFEPCGISQLIAMRYGSLPLVRATGGLIDTVIPYDSNSGQGTGFSFTEYNSKEILRTFRQAKKVYFEQPDVYQRLTKQAMRNDSSWQHSTAEYFSLFESLLIKS